LVARCRRVGKPDQRRLRSGRHGIFRQRQPEHLGLGRADPVAQQIRRRRRGAFTRQRSQQFLKLGQREIARRANALGRDAARRR